ncbi:MAG: Sapep family Mn(2+)-dependent dipeptidase [Brevinema sp.]
MISQKILLQEYHKIQQNLLESLSSIISIPSFFVDDSSATPFGLPIDQCLDTTLKICQHLGFHTKKDPEGYYGYAEIGTGTELIGILCHLDVVPADPPWDTNPFTLTRQNNKLIARGIADDKGPTMVCLYALKSAINLSSSINKRFRFIFGTDEENLWKCIHQYKQKEEIPTRGFTPDGSFPVVYAEKGLLQFILQGKGESINIQGGGVFNAVPDQIKYYGPKQDMLESELLKKGYPFKKNKSSITIIGKTVHAQSTEKGINAITRLMICLHNIGISSPSINFITDKININPYGELLFGTIEDIVSGKLKTNLSKVEINDQYSKLYFDFRIPVTQDINQLIESLKHIISPYCLEYKEYDRVESLYIPKDDPLIQLLCKLYHEETGLDATPISTGGATYSRALKNFITFGMKFPYSADTAHQKHEYITLEDMEQAFIIYTKTFLALNNELK